MNKHLLIISILYLFLPSIASSAPKIIGFHEDNDTHVLHLFYADEADINKIIAWSPERDAGFKNLKELIDIAKSRLQAPPEQSTRSLHSVEWTHLDYCWIVTVTFYSNIKTNPIARGGDTITAIRMLPNGGEVIEKTRKMRQDEINGAVPPELK